MYFKIQGLETIEDLPNFEEVRDGIRQMPKALRDPFVRYHIYMYDKGSPFVENIRKLDRRQSAVLEEIGIDQKRWSAEIEQMRSLQHEAQQPLIMAILMAQNDHLFNQLVINEQAHYKVIEEVTAPTPEDADKTTILGKQMKLLRDSEELVDRIEGLHKRIYSSVDAEEIKKVRIPISPETLRMFVSR